MRFVNIGRAGREESPRSSAVTGGERISVWPVEPDVVASPLPPGTARDVERLATAAASYDGVAPLNEQTLLRLTGRPDGDRHLLVRDERGDLAGYAYRGTDGSAEVVVAPGARRRGIGTALVRALLDLPGPEPRVWAHGRIDGVDAFAARNGFVPARELFKLARDGETAPELPEPVLPDGIEVRTFEPGGDDDAWLAVNARAFAGHPEQGAWGPDDLADRLAQPWFDPAGFFLAVDTRRGGALAGFHWTKVHDGTGEVYVVGADPAYQGTGLGKALTTIGVRYLHGRGLRTVELYVDGSNTPARALYAKLGFAEATVDVQYRPM